MVVKKSVGKSFTAVGSSIENNSCNPIFDNLGIMLHGEKNFCIDMAKIVKVVWFLKSLSNYCLLYFPAVLLLSCS